MNARDEPIADDHDRTAGRGLARRRILLAAFGDPGHAFPMLALGEQLVARGHIVCLQTWRKWQEPVVAAGMEFSAAPEYPVFPTQERPLKPFQAVLRATTETLPLVESFAPDVVVHDILTQAPALAAELAGCPVATLIPHLSPHHEPHFPIYSTGARLPRTRVGREFWRKCHPLIEHGLRRGRDELNETRSRLGLAPRDWLFNGWSSELVMVATVPELEYPRMWPDRVKVVGPLMWEPPGEGVPAPTGDGPVVLVAPSTSQDPSHSLLRASLEALAGMPVRVIATYNGRTPDPPIAVPRNAVLVDWLSYSKTMPECDLVICHGGHGTLMRALSNGCRVVICPAGGDMPENAARIAWAGLGARIARRLLSARTIRWTVEHALADDRMCRRVSELAANMERRGQSEAVNEIEAWARNRTGGIPDRTEQVEAE